MKYTIHTVNTKKSIPKRNIAALIGSSVVRVVKEEGKKSSYKNGKNK